MRYAVPIPLWAMLSAPIPAQVTEAWHASSGRLPSEDLPAWTLQMDTKSCSAASVNLIGNTLRIDHSSVCSVDSLFYSTYKSGPVGAPPATYWIEARCRVVSSNASDPNRGVAALALAPPSICPWTLELDLGWLSLNWATIQHFGAVNIDTSSGMRTYRLEVDPATYLARVYVDGALVLSAPAPSQPLLCFNPSFTQLTAVFGNVFPMEGGVSEWESVQHNLGNGVTTFCAPAQPNSAGLSARLQHTGGLDLATNDTVLHASGVPNAAFGYFVCSRVHQAPAGLPGSQGHLCLGPPIGRFNRPGEILSSGPSGAMQLTLDLTNLPQPSGSSAATTGESWHFQLWYRDANPQVTSNLSEAIRLTFE